MNPFICVSVFIIALSSFFFLTGYLCFVRACKRSLRRDPAARGYINFDRYGKDRELMIRAVDQYEKIPKESICIDAFDGIKLHASYMRSPECSDKTVILLHGYHSCAAADFAPVVPKLLENGYNILAVDQRSHGRSSGKYICFGDLESRDCRSWCEYVNNRFGEGSSIYLYGVSMGASTVLMSLATELPQNVRAIVADCGFTTPWDIIKIRLIRKHKIPPYPIIYFMNYWAKNLAGFDFRSASSTVALQKNDNVPVLLIHGDADRYVPISMSEQNHSASPQMSRFIKFNGAAHARSSLTDSTRYLYELLNFFENCQK